MNQYGSVIGYTVRARKIAGGAWLIYQLTDEEKPDRAGNRSPIDIVDNRRDAYEYVRSLDYIPEEGDDEWLN